MKSFILTLSFFIASPCFGNERYPSQVIWGSYCGECIGECSTMRKITNGGLMIDQSNNFLKSNPSSFTYEFNGAPESILEYEKYKWLLRTPISESLNKNQMIFGQPDAYDQCGYFFVFRVGSSDIKVLVDPNMVPSELAPLVEKLFHGGKRKMQKGN